MKYEQLDARLRIEALALIRASLGDHREKFEYCEIAENLAVFEEGLPKAQTLRPRDPRHLEFLKELRIVTRDRDGYKLNVKAQADLNKPILMWDWNVPGSRR